MKIYTTEKTKIIRAADDKSIRDRIHRRTLQSIGKAFSFFVFSLLLLTAANVDVRGQLDINFDPNVRGGASLPIPSVNTIAVQPDGKIIFGGAFLTVGGVSRNHLARVNSDGMLDTTFNAPPLNGSIFDITLQPDGKILIAGTFTPTATLPRVNLARLNSDGTLDTTFNAGAGMRVPQGVGKIIVLPDGKILVVGNFYFLNNGEEFLGIGRFNSDGSVDQTFRPAQLYGGTYDIKLQPDGKILVAGAFLNPFSDPLIRFGLRRLNSNGTSDTTFVPGLTSVVDNTSIVNSLALLPDGKILVGGNFAINGGQNTLATHLVRLNSNGGLDNAFNPNINNFSNAPVNAIAVQADGKILIGGTFEYQDGQQFRRGFQRLNADGTTDTSFNPNSNRYVNEIVIQPNGDFLVGGSFSIIGGDLRFCLARFLGNSVAARRSQFDFDGDGKSDISVFRPSNGTWYLQQSANGFAGLQFGASTDRIVPADYDGDGKTDVAVFRNGTWYLNRSQLGFTGIAFGAADDIPVPADYDGDGKGDIAVFRPSNGTWYIQRPQLGLVGITFGQTGDKPVAADYDGDGKTDVAVYRAETWYLNRSQLGFTGISFGESTDKPTPADYDGDGKSDVAVFRPSNGTWYLQRSTAGFTGIAFGIGTDSPTPADYDGDGKADVAVYRGGTWYLNRSQAGFTGVSFGASDDKPVLNAFVP